MSSFFLRLFLLFALFVPFASAVIETYEFSHPDLEARYRQLSAELRCPKCQNQNIADSNAPIAKDLRMLLHRQLEAGASNPEIKQFMVARYGEFVLYRPRFSGATSILWLAPVLLLVCAIVIVVLSVRRKNTGSATGVGVSEAEREQLRKLLDDEEDQS